MYIQEAIKSGKPFKRPHWPNWVETTYTCICYRREGETLKFVTKEDVLANDWIVQGQDIAQDSLEDLKKAVSSFTLENT